MSATISAQADASSNFKARMGGFFWLMTVVTGMFAMVAYQRVVIPKDAAATIANLLTQETLFRAGVASNILATACYIGATLFVYALLKPVNRNVSLLAAFFSLAGCAGGAVTSVCQLAPFSILEGGSYLSVFTSGQLNALAILFLRISGQAFFISHVFFGLHCLLVGVLIFRSTFLPRAVGVLMVIAGASWLTMSFAGLLSAPLGPLSSYLMAAGGLGELTLTLWLLVRGVKKQAPLVPALATGA